MTTDPATARWWHVEEQSREQGGVTEPSAPPGEKPSAHPAAALSAFPAEKQSPPPARGKGPARVRCELCPHRCLIAPGKLGFCNARQNQDGRLVSLTYGHPRGLAVDPIEKKPLYHFLPGSQVLSFGTTGCTLACTFCQNWHLSQCVPGSGEAPDPRRERTVAPEEIVELARREVVPTLAYTYNEPTVFAEYLVDVAARARSAGLRNVMVSNGYISPRAREEVMAEIDGINVDLKAFSEAFYRQQAKARLEPVLDTLRWIARQPAIWLEVTTLLIPGLNDSAAELEEQCAWIAGELGPEVPLHFSAFHPAYKLQDRPPTPEETLLRARETALRAGLQYVYLGNVSSTTGHQTHCPRCGAVVIERAYFRTTRVKLRGGACPECGAAVAGVFNADETKGH